MILPPYLFIALRYLQTSNKNASIKTMLKICFIGIFLGTCSLALIASIMKGFEQATYKKMQTIYPQIIIDAHEEELAYEKIVPILQDPKFQVQYYAPQQRQQALFDGGNNTTPHVIQLRGIQPHLEQHVTPISSMLLPKGQSHNLEAIVQKKQIIIGKKLASYAQVSTGSYINILYTADDSPMTNKVRFHQKPALISGIFETGIDDFDAHLVYCASDFFEEIFQETGITQIYLQLTANACEEATISKLQKRLHLHVYSWKELYKTLVSALELEKYAMFLILLLIIIIASTNIISLLFMQILQKKKDIALLITLGLTKQKIRMIFLTLSMLITTLAATSGLTLAYFLGLILKHYRWIKLPDNIYYTTHLPITLDPLLFLYIFFVVLSISFIASLIPLRNIKTIDIATILRNEM